MIIGIVLIFPYLPTILSEIIIFVRSFQKIAHFIPCIICGQIWEYEAIEHIAAHSTGHSEAIVTRDEAAAEAFAARVDAAAVYVNASTRFTDGGEFGLGCEIGISTQKLHARGPMGLREICTYKYVVRGNGHIR